MGQPRTLDLGRRPHTFNTNYLGGSPKQFPDRYRFVGSATHINAAAPPTLVIFGANDHLVPPAATDRFVQQAYSAGVKIDGVRLPYADHAFNLNQYSIGNQFYLGMTERFLIAHGQGPGIATAPPPSRSCNAIKVNDGGIGGALRRANEQEPVESFIS